MTPPQLHDFFAEERHAANWGHRPGGPSAINAQERFKTPAPSILIDAPWNTPAYVDPDALLAGPPQLGVDSVELTDPRFGHRLADVMISQDTVVPGTSCSYLEY